MIMNRRTFTSGLGLAALAAASGMLAGPALAQSFDMEEFMKAPRIGDKSIGPADAKVTIVEYASATCPHCAKFHTTVFPDIKKEFVDTGKVRLHRPGVSARRPGAGGVHGRPLRAGRQVLRHAGR